MENIFLFIFMGYMLDKNVKKKYQNQLVTTTRKKETTLNSSGLGFNPLLANCVTLGRLFTFWYPAASIESGHLAVIRQTLGVWGGTRGHAGGQRPQDKRDAC